ncbi:MAG: TolC family outer membrane protein [Burkholderiaceae bacterium]|nr:TolC family outer membrane protein [Burkholderiaceae bacterium]
MKRRIAVKALANAIAGVVLAAPALPASAFDLMQAWREALANDAQVASARSQLDATRERVPQARSQLLPAVAATAGMNRVHVDPNRGPDRSFTSEAYAIQLSMPLLSLPEQQAWEQSKLAVGIAEAQYAQAQQDLILRVSRAYFDVLAAQDNLETIRAQKRAIAEQLEAAKRNFEVGTATITDQQEAQARFDLTVAQEIAAINALDVQRALLAQLVGRPAGELDILRRGVLLQPPQPASEAEWVRQATDSSLAVQQQRVNVEIARREIERRRYAKYPSVDIVGSLARNESAALNTIGLRTNSATVGVQLSVPLYTGGGIEAGVREAAALLDRSQSDLETTRRQIEQATRQAYLGVNSSLAQVSALEAAERSSQLALESNLLGYQVGVRINIDVLNAQQQLFSTRRDLSRARYDVIVNGLQLKSTAGALGEDDVAAVDALLAPPTPGQPERGPSPSATPLPPPTTSSPPASATPEAPAPAAPQGPGRDAPQAPIRR